jgi:hypothetical protein
VADPDLDAWLPDTALRIEHRQMSDAAPSLVWNAAREVRLRETGLLGRLIRWRIPGVPAGTSFRELFGGPPFLVLEVGEGWLLSGIVGRIWTIRRDYPVLADAEAFRSWSRPGTARVLFANWVEGRVSGGSVLRSEARVEAFGVQGRLGLGSVRPLIRGFEHLIATDALAVVVRAAERDEEERERERERERK